jgi:hypothetical protein
MSQWRQVVFVALAGLVAGSVAHVADPSGTTGALVFLAAGLVIGELLVLRLENGTAVPLSYAVLLVLASSFPASRYAGAVVGAELISAVLQLSDRESTWRVRVMAERLAVAAVTIAVYDGMRALTHHDETVAAVLLALAAAAVSQLPVDLAMRWILRLHPLFSARARLAWLAIASSGILMAVGYRGVDGMGSVGIWGPLLFSTPLLAAYYAFERLDTATLAYRQTIEALAMAPEFGGIVPPGHSQRVAALSSAMAGELGLPATDTSDLEMAALLHHLGQVTIDEPEDPSRPIPASEVAAVTSTMLREIKPLAAAGDIVAGDAADPRRRVAVQVLRVASDYDDLTARDGNDERVAIETLRSAPGYVYDVKVLRALERVVGSDQ